jgi:putative membrane protein
MPSEPRRLHPFSIASRALRLARQLLLPAVLGGASVGGDLRGVLVWIFLILALPSVLLAAAQWLAFRFRLESDDLVIDSGVFGRRRRVIPIDRVQNVDLEQSALERLVGVAELRIETASGGREAEASLSVLSLAEARAVQADLLARRATARATPAAGSGDRPLLQLTVLDLALAGATSNEAGLIAAGLATLLEVAGRFGALTTVAHRLDNAVSGGFGAGAVGAATAIALVILAFVVLGWVVSIVATVVRYHGFTLTRVGDDLRLEHGLLSRHHTTVPLARVQAVRIQVTIPRRALGLAALRIDTAGSGPGARGGTGGRTDAHVPISRRSDVARLLREVLPDARLDHDHLQPVAPASRRRERVRLTFLVAVFTVGLATWGLPRAWLAVLLLAPAWALAGARYRARGWNHDDLHLIAREGVLTRTTWVVPRRKIQTLHATETPFQRRWRLATLLVDTAAGVRPARVVDLHRATAARLLVELRADDSAPPAHHPPSTDSYQAT